MERFDTCRSTLSLGKPLAWYIRNLTVALVFMLAGCAGGDPDDHNALAAIPDAGIDQEDSGGQTPPGTQDPPDVIEGEDDLGPSDPPPVCTADHKKCADENTVETCQPDGQGYLTTPCSSGQICVDGDCVIEPVCTPGETRCADNKNLLTCRPDGGGNLTTPCPGDEICFNDRCVSGSANGQSCQENSDCASGLCRCGAEEECPPNSKSYCTSDCSQNPCSAGQICWKNSGNDPDSYDHCLLSCQGVCSISGLDCAEIQTEIESEPTWRGACLPPGLKSVGTRCERDDECINGQCSSDYFGFGVCTHRCEDRGCPSKTACVKLTSTQAWCSPLCTDGGDHCALDKPNRIVSSCQERNIIGGGQAIVCTK